MIYILQRENKTFKVHLDSFGESSNIQSGNTEAGRIQTKSNVQLKILFCGIKVNPCTCTEVMYGSYGP